MAKVIAESDVVDHNRGRAGQTGAEIDLRRGCRSACSPGR